MEMIWIFWGEVAEQLSRARRNAVMAAPWSVDAGVSLAPAASFSGKLGNPGRWLEALPERHKITDEPRTNAQRGAGLTGLSVA